MFAWLLCAMANHNPYDARYKKSCGMDNPNDANCPNNNCNYKECKYLYWANPLVDRSDIRCVNAYVVCPNTCSLTVPMCCAGRGEMEVNEPSCVVRAQVPDCYG
eukprot:COSAG01_NODE_473_length_16542_cov_42.403651_4_plen_104_part_00